MARFEESWLSSVPQPDRRSIDDYAGLGVDRLRQRGQESLAGVWYWSQRLADAAAQIDEALVGVPSVARISVGFIEERDGAFGVIVYADGPPPDDPLRTDSNALPTDPPPIRVDGVSLPVVVRPVYSEEHWCTAPNILTPTTARATCWVRAQHLNVEGWLVPRHALQPLNTVVGFDNGDQGTCAHSFGACVDAAIVAVDQPSRHHHLPTAANWPVVPGQPVLVTDQPGSHVRATVLDVDLNLGVLRLAVFPVRFTMDWYGVPGQSGALVVDDSAGEPAGLYLGLLRPSNGTAGPFGYGQTCHQLALATGMEFYL